MDLTGKVALITGAARCLGKACAQALLEAGGRVSIVDILSKEGLETEREFQQKYGPRVAIFIHCDVTNDKQLQDAFTKTKDHFGQLDIVMNNAGVYVHGSHDQDDKIINTNLTATIKGTYLGVKYLSQKNGGNGGVILNMSSIVGLDVYPEDSFVVYSATRHGVVGLCRTLAGSMGDPVKAGHGVRILCLCPHGTRGTTMYNEAMKNESMSPILEKLGFIQIPDVVDGFLKLLKETNNHGGVLTVGPGSLDYKYRNE